MNNQIVFNLSSDCQLDFIFTRVLKDRGKVQSLVAFIQVTMPPPSEGVIFKSLERSILIEDWNRLCDYLENHILAQQVDMPQKSPEFAPHELQFKIYAQRGSVYAVNDGSFRLQIFLNTSYDPDHHFRRYVGIDTVVGVKNVTDFITALRAYLNDVQLDDETKQP